MAAVRNLEMMARAELEMTVDGYSGDEDKRDDRGGDGIRSPQIVFQFLFSKFPPLSSLNTETGN